jgi:class 3 adenylate cyclase
MNGLPPSRSSNAPNLWRPARARAGNIGSQDYQNFTAVGDTTNLAARLGGIAKPGEVVIGPLTAAELHGPFELSPLGPVNVKGSRRAGTGV